MMDISEIAARIARVQWRFVWRSTNNYDNWVARHCKQEMCPINWALNHHSPLVSLSLLYNICLEMIVWNTNWISPRKKKVTYC